MIVVALLLVFGVLIGVSLGSVGAGGSILAVPVLVYVAGESPKAATASSLVVVFLTAIIALRPHWSAGRVRRDIAVPFGLVGVASSVAGNAIGQRLDADALMLAFSFVMVAAAIALVRRTRSCVSTSSTSSTSSTGLPSPAAPSRSLPQTSPVALLERLEHLDRRDRPVVSLAFRARIVGAGIVVGLMTGFFGVGGGFVIVPALVLLLGLSMTDAVGTSLLIIVINTSGAFALKARGLDLDWGVIVVFSAAAGCGALLGGRVARHVDNARLTRWFVAVVVTVAVYMAIRSGAALGA